MEIKDIGEKNLIDKIWKILGKDNEDEDVHFFELGSKYILLAMDTINEGFHFEKNWDPKLVGKFLVDINLSDIASKNGEPSEIMVSMSLPRDLPEDWVTSFIQGVKLECEAYGMTYSGGDLKESKFISLTGLVIGQVERGREYRRSGARPGDNIYISSMIGKNELAILRYYEDNESYRDILYFIPRFNVLKTLMSHPITSCIDNSDGIYKSLMILADRSRVKIKIEKNVCEKCSSEEERKSVYSLGGDYELIFTSPDIIEEFPLLGKVVEGEGVIDIDGTSRIPAGYDHFATKFHD